MERNIKIAYVVGSLRNSWFWLGVWILVYLSITDYAGLGLVEAALFVTTILLEVPTGAFADLVGKRITLVLAFMFSAICNISIAFSQNLQQLILSVIIGGVGMSLYSGAFEAMVYDSLLEIKKEAKYIQVISRVNALQLLTMAFCSIVGGFLYNVDHKLPFLLNGIMVGIASGLALGLVEPKKDTQKVSWGCYWQQNAEGFGHLFNKGLAWSVPFLLVVGSFYALSEEMLDSVLWVEFGLRPELLGILFSTISIIGAGFSYLSSKFVVGNIFWGILFISTISGISYVLSPMVGVVVGSVLLIVRNSMMAVHQNYLSTFINQHISSKYRATTLSSFSLLKMLPYAISAPFLGMMMQQVTAKRFTLVMGVTMLVITMWQGVVYFYQKGGRAYRVNY